VPHGAYLIGHDRRWSYDDVRDRRFRYTDFDGPRYYGNRERYREIREYRAAKRDVHEDRAELKNNLAELKKDRRAKARYSGRRQPQGDCPGETRNPSGSTKDRGESERVGAKRESA
jgi:hypothetical protein